MTDEKPTPKPLSGGRDLYRERHPAPGERNPDPADAESTRPGRDLYRTRNHRGDDAA